MTAATLPLTLAERDFQRTLIDYAILRGWRVSHSRPARTARGWATPIEGHPGAPDLLLARDGVVLLAELKSHRGVVSREQSAWLAAVGSHGRLWKPINWTEIVEELR